MKINVVAVGKIKESFYRDAVAEYAKRLTRFCTFKVIEVSESMLTGRNAKDIQKVVESEGQSILAKVKGHIIVLDLMGKMLSSEDIADYVQHITSGGVSEITFVIGGSYGLSEEVKRRADYSICFGKVTYPHQLMRVILSEQIYRAFMINENSEYHK